jgi:hypothetical protein
MHRRTGHPTRLANGGYQVGNRAFKTGQYVKTSDGFRGYIFGESGDREENRTYQVAICERDEERNVPASELTWWSPKASERVIEANNENCVIGIVIDVFDECRALVKWQGFTRLQSWLYADLERACD